MGGEGGGWEVEIFEKSQEGGSIISCKKWEGNPFWHVCMEAGSTVRP